MPLYPAPRNRAAPSAIPRRICLLKSFALLLALLLIISCGCQSDADRDFPPMGFEVNQDLLSASVVVDGTLSMQPPSNWPEIGAEAFSAAKEVIDNDTSSFFELETLRIFMSPAGASCIISKVLGNPPLFGLLDASFEESLKLTFQTEKVARGSFSVGGIKTVQYRIITPDIIAFKLFCRVGNRYYQIDYFIPAGIYQTEVRKVESSIGSITPAKE